MSTRLYVRESTNEAKNYEEENLCKCNGGRNAGKYGFLGSCWKCRS